jgi:hypothetical protein
MHPPVVANINKQSAWAFLCEANIEALALLAI